MELPSAEQIRRNFTKLVILEILPTGGSFSGGRSWELLAEGVCSVEVIASNTMC